MIKQTSISGTNYQMDRNKTSAGSTDKRHFTVYKYKTRKISYIMKEAKDNLMTDITN